MEERSLSRAVEMFHLKMTALAEMKDDGWPTSMPAQIRGALCMGKQ